MSQPPAVADPQPPQGFGSYPGNGNPYAAPGGATYAPVPSYGPGPGAVGSSLFPGPSPAFSSGPVPVRRSPIRLVLLALIALALLAIAGLVLASRLVGPTEVAYANDDYQVPPPEANPPPILIPETADQLTQWLEANAIYGRTMPAPVRCNSVPIDVQTADATELKSHFDGLIECLVRAWQPPVTEAGFLITRPTITIYGDHITTKCGDSGVNAFYCSADQQLYYSTQLPVAFGNLRGKWAADVVMAHEYGHLIQGRTGLFAAGIIASQQAGSTEAGLIFRRRLETQADCMSATFIRSVSRSLNIQQQDVDEILTSYEAVGDDVISGQPDINGDHGLARSRRYWGNVGLVTGAIGQCNTFTADDTLVR